MESKTLHQSPLHDLYPDDPPLMEFGGWEMPRDFGGIVREHRDVRNDFGVFDLSHMGRLVLSGSGSQDEIDQLFTRTVPDADPGQALYGFFCDEQGGCLDDAILYRKSPDETWMIVNAANRERIVDWIESHVSSHLDDRTFDTALFALQGPNARARIDNLNLPELPDIPFRTNWQEQTMIASTGYTGEDGGEVWLDNESAKNLFEEIVDRGHTLCGLGARDTLRLEKGYPLHGHELSKEIDPVTAGFEQFIDWDSDFIGRDSLKTIRDNGPVKNITGIVTEGRRSPREGYPLRIDEQNEIGTITSGGFSPILNCGIGMAMISADVPGDAPLEMKVRGEWETVTQQQPPFV